MILLIAGTSDSRLLARELLKENFKIIASTASEYGKKLMEKEGVLVRAGKMGFEEISLFVEENNIKIIVDASHPYAINISEKLIKLSKILKIPYLRYERKLLNYKNAKKFETYKEVSDFLVLKEGNILLTTGSNNLKDFAESKIEKPRIFLRILPTENSIKKAEDLGFVPKQILALQGPFSKDFNKAIYKEYKIKYILSKESGIEGGELEKLESAKEEGVEVLVIKRPFVNYPKVFYNFKTLITELKK